MHYYNTVKQFSEIVMKSLAKLDEFSRKLMEQFVIKGSSDLYIYMSNKISKSTYYHLKANFQHSLFYLCICMGLVTEEDI